MSWIMVILLCAIAAGFSSFVLIKCNIVEKNKAAFFVLIFIVSLILAIIIFRSLLLLGFSGGFSLLLIIFILIIFSVIVAVTKKYRDRHQRAKQEKIVEEVENIYEDIRLKEEKKNATNIQKKPDEEIILQEGKCPVCGKTTADTDSVCINCGFPVISLAGNIDKEERDRIIKTVKEYREIKQWEK